MKDRIHPNLRAMIDNMTEEQKGAISKKLSEPSEVSYEKMQQRLKEAFDPPQSEATIRGWVARTQNGTLGLCRIKPERRNGDWWIDIPPEDFAIYRLPSELFPDLTWQDDPIEVEIHIKEIMMYTS